LLIADVLALFLLAWCGAGMSGTRPFRTLAIADGSPTSVAFSPDGKMLAAGVRVYRKSTDKWWSEVHLWAAESWSALPTLVLGEGVMDGGIGVAFSPDGTLLAAAEPQGTVHIWRTADWHPVEELASDPGLRALVAFSPDGKTLAATTSGGKVWRWTVANWGSLPALATADEGANVMTFSPDSRLLATGGANQAVHIWRLADGAPLQRLRGHTKGITALAFSPDGQTLASGSYDETMRLWRVADGQVLATWDITPADLLFALGGARIMESDLWTDPKILQVRDGAVVAQLRGDSQWDGISPKGASLALTADGRILAGGTGHGDIWLWAIP